MTTHPKASITMVWLRQLTTGTSTILHKKIGGLELNKLILILLLWIVLVLGVYLLTTAMFRERMNTMLETGSAAVQRLAEQSATLLLEDELLGLNRWVGDFVKERRVNFAIIVDHENRVVAHSDPERLNLPYVSLPDLSFEREISLVKVHRGSDADGQPILMFTRHIEFSGVRVGQAVIGEPADTLHALQGRFRLYAALMYGLVTFGALGTILLSGRRRPPAPPKGSPAIPDGSRIGPYHLRRHIARGGMAELYQADYLREDGFRRNVAIKKVLPHLAENPDFINMFIREARLAALLQHPNIVQIFDFGKIQNTHFIAMEYIHGLTLGEIMVRLKTGMPIEMAVYIALNVSLGLDYSHQRRDDDTGRPLGIIHRDISPQNILISYQGEVKLNDFGISKATTEPSMTQAGVIKGKLSYLSPEQAMGKPADQQSDIYAFGLVMYEILSGRRLYQFDSDIEAIRAIPEKVIAPLMSIRPEVPEALDRIVMTCLEKDTGLRYRTAAALHQALAEFKTQRHITFDSSDLAHFMTNTFQDK